jgi:phosphinothricin acetyltransferase
VPVGVRPGRLDDLPTLTEIYNHFVVNTHVTFDLEPFTVAERAEWFSHYDDTGPHRLLVAVDGDQADGGAVLGYATSGRFRDKAAYNPSVETTIYCSVDALGRGVGSALYAALFEVLADEQVHRAYAGVALPNDASLALHERFGFTVVGTFHEVGRKFDQWWDVRWLERAVKREQTRHEPAVRTSPPGSLPRHRADAGQVRPLRPGPPGGPGRSAH